MHLKILRRQGRIRKTNEETTRRINKDQLRKKEETKKQVTEEPEIDVQFDASNNKKLDQVLSKESILQNKNKQGEYIEKTVSQQDLQEQKPMAPESSTQDSIPDITIKPKDQKDASEV